MHPTARLDRTLLARAEAQHGLLTTAQCAGFGLSRGAVEGLIERGSLDRIQRGVLRVSGSPATFEQALACQVLLIGRPVAVSGGAGARVWGFEEMGHGQPELTVPAWRRVRRVVPVTLVRRDLPSSHWTVRHQLPVTTPSRTIADLAISPFAGRLVKRFTDHLVRARHVSIRDLLVGVELMADHPGGAAMRRLLEGHLEGARLTDSSPHSSGEIWVRRISAAGGLPPMVTQHRLDLPSGSIYLDVAIPHLRIAIEFDSYPIHTARTAFDNDRRRWDDITAAGWRLIIVTSEMSDDEVVRRIGRAVEERTATVTLR